MKWNVKCLLEGIIFKQMLLEQMLLERVLSEKILLEQMLLKQMLFLTNFVRKNVRMNAFWRNVVRKKVGKQMLLW